jgi:hypothetical protein
MLGECWETGTRREALTMLALYVVGARGYGPSSDRRERPSMAHES